MKLKSLLLFFFFAMVTLVTNAITLEPGSYRANVTGSWSLPSGITKAASADAQQTFYGIRQWNSTNTFWVYSVNDVLVSMTSGSNDYLMTLENADMSIFSLYGNGTDGYYMQCKGSKKYVSFDGTLTQIKLVDNVDNAVRLFCNNGLYCVYEGKNYYIDLSYSSAGNLTWVQNDNAPSGTNSRNLAFKTYSSTTTVKEAVTGEVVLSKAETFIAAKEDNVGRLGFVKQEIFNAFLDVYNAFNTDQENEDKCWALYNAITSVNNAANIVFPEDGKIYTIKSKGYYVSGSSIPSDKGYYLLDETTASGSNITLSETITESETQFFFKTIALETAGRYNLQNVATNRYINQKLSSETQAYMTFTATGNGTFRIKSENQTSNYIVWPENNRLDYYSADNVAGEFTLTEIGSYTLTMPSESIKEMPYATTCLPFNASLPEGLEMMTATVDGETVKLETRNETILPSEVGVILKGTQGQTYTFYETTKEPTSTTFDNNELIGTTEKKSVDSDKCYALSWFAETGAGFYKLGSMTIPANRAYLSLSSNSNSFIFNNDFVTGINNAEVAGQNTNMYDLQGRSVKNPSKGLYINNGKKVIVNN